jgi:hypothetical protein
MRHPPRANQRRHLLICQRRQPYVLIAVPVVAAVIIP